MPWLKVANGFTRHPKVEPLSDKAFRLLVCLLDHCAEFSTDGAVDKSAMGRIHSTINLRFTRRSTPLSELIRRGLVSVSDDAWVVHDFLDYNPSSAQVKEQRAADAERQRRSRDRRHGVTHALVTAPEPYRTDKEELKTEESNHRPKDNSPWAHPPKPKPRPSTGDPDLDAEMRRN